MPYNYQNQPQGFGWFGATPYGNQQPINNNNDNNNPMMPKAPNTPNLYQPNFVPPVYYPNQFQYPTFPNMFPFQPHFGFNPHGQFNGQSPHHGRPHGTDQQHNHQRPPFNSFNNRPDGGNQPQPFPPTGNQNTNNQAEDKFATDAFFGNNHNHHWTEDDEMKWQATTKAPYFENKVPGLECTLPASAVLGATTALKASNLLPLNVPIGKPILSCNASELLQAQINLDGIIYDCRGPSIIMSCPRYDASNVLKDECRDETLECDVRMPHNTRSVSCTNGTLISNQVIVCKSATLMEHKNVLNCLYKHNLDSVIPLTTLAPPRVNNQPRPTSRPITTTTESLLQYIPPAQPDIDEQQQIDDLDTRYSSDKNTLDTNDLTHDVRRALETIFPHELLASQTRMYLPPQSSSSGQIPEDLRNQLQGVFPHQLFAMSQNDNTNGIDNLYIGDNESRLSAANRESINNQQSLTQIKEAQWSVNPNTNTGNSGTKTKTNQDRLTSRFAAEAESIKNNNNLNEDRLIFSS